MRDTWYRLLVAWYRLTGASEVQAEWKARRALKKPGEAKEALAADARRTADRRYNCVCGQLLTAEDTVCHRCGRKQYLPFWARRILRTFGLVVPSASAGCIIVGALMLIGYAIQVRYGTGGFLSPTGSGRELYDLGASRRSLTLGGQWWRGVTYVYLHGGLMHIAFNGILLMQIGPMMERIFGTARFLFCWVVAGAIAVYLPAMLSPGDVWVVGASGSGFGLIGMAMLWGHRQGTTQGRFVRDVMIRWTIYSTLFGFMIGGVAHGAHFAGLAAGALFGTIFPPPERSPSRRALSPALGTVAMGVLVGGLAMFGSWFADGRPAPESAGPQFQAALLYDQGQTEGWESVFDAEAMAVLNEARRVRKAGHPEADVAALFQRADAVLLRMDEARQIVFADRLRARLYPNGVPSSRRGGEMAPTAP